MNELDSLLISLLTHSTPTSYSSGGDSGLPSMIFTRCGLGVQVSLVSTKAYINDEPSHRRVVRVERGGFLLATSTKEVLDAWDACLIRTQTIKEAQIISTLKVLTGGASGS